MEKQKCPEVRFKGFNENWYIKTIGETCQINMGQSPDGENYTDNPQDYILVQGNADLKDGEVIPRVYTSQITKLANKGDIILTVRAPVGATAITNYDVVLGRGVAAVKGNLFVYYALKLVDQLGVWERYSSGSTFDSINSNDINGLLLSFTDEVEQTQVGNFFQNLDQSIALHEKKLAQTQNLKKAMLEKMFPKVGSMQPEIRLKGFSGDWKVDAIGNVLQEIFRPINLDNETKYRLVTVKRRNGGIAERAILKGKDILVKSQFEVKAGDYIISKRQVVHGATGLVPNELDGSIVSNEYLIGQSTDKLNIEFFALLSTLPEMYKKFFLSSYGVDIEKLFFDVNDWKKREILLPWPAEQIQISKFFKQLDETIVLQQQQLQTLKNLKQAFLEKMFV